MTALVEAVVPVGPLALRKGTLRLMLMVIFQIFLWSASANERDEPTFQSSLEYNTLYSNNPIHSGESTDQSGLYETLQMPRLPLEP